MSNSIERLVERFRQFPGIGPRQARRFVYFLLTRNREYLEELSELITNIKREVHICPSCMRFFANSKSPTCSICVDYNRDSSLLLVTEKDVDLDNMEKSGAYHGFYFVFKEKDGFSIELCRLNILVLKGQLWLLR